MTTRVFDPTLRDHGYEDQFLAEAAKFAERRFGLVVVGFEAAVKRRLEMGERLYGSRYMLQTPEQRALAIMEEAQDAAAYAVMDTQVRLARGTDDAAAWRLFEIAQVAAVQEAHARQLRAGTDEA